MTLDTVAYVLYGPTASAMSSAGQLDTLNVMFSILSGQSSSRSSRKAGGKPASMENFSKWRNDTGAIDPSPSSRGTELKGGFEAKILDR